MILDDYGCEWLIDARRNTFAYLMDAWWLLPYFEVWTLYGYYPDGTMERLV